MPFVDCDGAELYYESYGEGPVLVLAHGVGGNHASWYHQIPVFSKSYRVIAFDHRGFGKSTDVKGLGRAAFVDDLGRLIDKLELDKVVLIAQSMGGGTCLGYTCQHPERVRALVLADTMVGFKEPEDIREYMVEARAKTETLSQVERVLGPRVREKEPEKALLYTQIAGFNAVNRKTLKGSLARTYSPEDLAATGVPVLFVVGLDDVLFPPKAVKVIQARVKGSFLVEIAGAGHSAYYESPAEFNDSVLSFLQAVGVKGVARAGHSNAPGYTPVS